MNLALKDISHNLGRFLLTCLGLSLLLGIVLAMIGIYRGLIVESLGLVRASGAQVSRPRPYLCASAQGIGHMMTLGWPRVAVIAR